MMFFASMALPKAPPQHAATRRSPAWAGLALAVFLSLSAGPARSEDAEALPQPQAQQQQPAPAPHQPGLIGAIGRWFEESSNDMSSRLKGAQQSIDTLNQRANRAGEEAAGAAKDAAGIARDAAQGLTTLPASRVVSGRSVCLTAPNGAPDCKAAADTLCKSRQFGRGTSLDTETAETCPPQVYLSGRPPKPGDCRIETFVTRAVCQ
jgi:hypothetical protein